MALEGEASNPVAVVSNGRETIVLTIARQISMLRNGRDRDEDRVRLCNRSSYSCDLLFDEKWLTICMWRDDLFMAIESEYVLSERFGVTGSMLIDCRRIATHTSLHLGEEVGVLSKGDSIMAMLFISYKAPFAKERYYRC